MTFKSTTLWASFWLGLSIVLTTIAQLLFRLAMTRVNFTSSQVHWDISVVLDTLSAEAIFKLLAGLTCYSISMVTWVMALSRFDVSAAYPMLSISHVLVYIGAVYLPWLGESASAIKLLGIAVIGAGVLVVTSGDAVNSSKDCRQNSQTRNDQ
jgi:undecaprenyl phosphate-alpha-L-ara4N flippase subunit ArnF